MRYKVQATTTSKSGKQTTRVAKRATKDKRACELYINALAKKVFAEHDDVDMCSFVNGWSLHYFLKDIGCKYDFKLITIFE